MSAQRLLFFLVVILFIASSSAAAAAGAAVSASSSSSAWVTPGDVPNLPTGSYFHLIDLLTNATTLSYVSTYGSYFEPKSQNATPSPDWEKSHIIANPDGCGMHALVFVQHSSRRVMIAFRGTDTDISHSSGQCDVCADALLWGQYPSNSPLPPFCSKYTRHQLDYFDRAREFVSKVGRTYPYYHMLFTGHSLGCGLASMFAGMSLDEACRRDIPKSVVEAGAVCFSSPPYAVPLSNRTSLNLTLNGVAFTKKTLVLADTWDPIYVNSAFGSPLGGMFATICTWTNGTEQEYCKRCEADPKTMDMNSRDCGMCFMARHEFKHYIALVKLRRKPDECRVQQRCDPVVSSKFCFSRGQC